MVGVLRKSHSVDSINAVFYPAFKSLQAELEKHAPKRKRKRGDKAAGSQSKLKPRKKPKRDWNTMAASSLFKAMGSTNKGFLKSLLDKGKVVKPLKRGGGLKWKVKMPPVTLAVKRVVVLEDAS